MQNQIKNDSSEWEVLSRPGYYGEHSYLRNKNGIVVDRAGLTREMIEEFSFKGNFGELIIQTSRWKDENNLEDVTDTCTVYLYWPRLEKEEVALARSMAKVIESALLNFPLSNINDFMPVREVLFKLQRGKPDLVRAEDIV